MEIHDRGLEFEGEDDRPAGAVGGSRSTSRASSPGFDAMRQHIKSMTIRWILEDASLDECQLLRRVVEEREARLGGRTPTPVPEFEAVPAPQPPPPRPVAVPAAPRDPAAQPPADVEFVWRLAPGQRVRVICSRDEDEE